MDVSPGNECRHSFCLWILSWYRNRQCRFPRYSKQATNAFIRHKTRGSAEENDRRSLAGDRPILQGPERGSHAGGVVTAGYRDHANSQAVAEVKAVGGDWPDSAEETASPFREPAKRPAREGDDVIRDGCQTLPRPGRKRKEVTSQLPVCFSPRASHGTNRDIIHGCWRCCQPTSMATGGSQSALFRTGWPAIGGWVFTVAA